MLGLPEGKPSSTGDSNKPFTPAKTTNKQTGENEPTPGRADFDLRAMIFKFQFFGGVNEEVHPTWRIMPVSKWLINMAGKSPK